MYYSVLIFLATLIGKSKCQKHHSISEVANSWNYIPQDVSRNYIPQDVSWNYIPQDDSWNYIPQDDSWKYSFPHGSTYFGNPYDGIFNGAFTIGSLGNLQSSGQFENTEYQRVHEGDHFVNVDRVNQHQTPHLRQIDPIEVLYPVEVDVPIAVDTPYPVEVPVSEPIEVLVHVPRDIPFPVEVPLPYKVPFPVEREVRVPIDNPVPYKVDVGIPFDVPIPVPVEVPEGVPYPIEVLEPVAYEVEVPYYVPYDVNVDVPIEVPVAVDVPQIIPYPVEVLVEYPYEVPVPYEVPFEVPYKVPYGVPVPVDVPVRIEVPHPVEVIVPSKGPKVIPYGLTDSGKMIHLKSFFPLGGAIRNGSDSINFGNNFLSSKPTDIHRGFSGIPWHDNMLNMIPPRSSKPTDIHRGFSGIPWHDNMLNMIPPRELLPRGIHRNNYFSDSSRFGTNILPPKYVYFNNGGSSALLNPHSYEFGNNMVPQVGNNVYERIVPNYILSNVNRFPFPSPDMEMASELSYFPFSERERVFGNSIYPSMISSYPSYLMGSGVQSGFWPNAITLNSNNMFGHNPAFNAYPKFVAFTNLQSPFVDPY